MWQFFDRGSLRVKDLFEMILEALTSTWDYHFLPHIEWQSWQLNNYSYYQSIHAK
jgi:hypothetical protein